MKRIFALLLVLMLTASGCKAATSSVSSGTASSDTVSNEFSDSEYTSSFDTLSENSNASESGSSYTSAVSSGTVASTPQNTFNPLYEYRKCYNLGNNKKLEGDITLHCFFVNDDEKEWNTRWADWFVETQIKHAMTFLINEAADYGKTLQFTPKYYLDCETADIETSTEYNKDHSMKYSGIIDPDSTDGTWSWDVLEKIAVNMGYSGALHFSTSLKQSNGGEHLFLFFVNKVGRSYCWQTTPQDTQINEHCLLFAYSEYTVDTGVKSEHTSLTIAHEMLHTFGAEDFYTPDERNALAEQYYPNDVMLKIDPPVRRGDIGELTAFQIGWTDTVPDICYNTSWWQ